MEAMCDANEMLGKAVAEIRYLEEGETYLVKDLFKGYLWKRDPLSNRLLLGTLFLNYVKSNHNCLNVIPIEKTPAGQQLYMIDGK